MPTELYTKSEIRQGGVLSSWLLKYVQNEVNDKMFYLHRVVDDEKNL